MTSLRESLASLPRVARWTIVVALVAATLGGVAGLVVGVAVNPATAWFAVIELGLPCTVLGAVVGAAAGSVRVVTGRRALRVRRSDRAATAAR